MMRILHSLPRTHKLLLLPVATMVTVLGAHKIVSTLEDSRYEHDTTQTDTLLVPLEPNISPGVPSLAWIATLSPKRSTSPRAPWTPLANTFRSRS